MNNFSNNINAHTNKDYRNMLIIILLVGIILLIINYQSIDFSFLCKLNKNKHKHKQHI